MTKAQNLLNEKLIEFNRSFEFDQRLFAHDVRVSIAYCNALFHAGIVTRIESERIKNGLQTILKRADFYTDYFEEPTASDVHSFVELRLIQLIGDAGEKLNVGRSRHDQAATAFRLWLREEIERISAAARDLQLILIDAGERQKEAVLPAYINSQRAQPVLWAHWCLAYFEMFSRDRERLDEVWRRVNVLPLGAGAAAGTSIEIDREEIAAALGFEGISANSLDTAADADFAVESVAACALTAIHVSRLAEDLILYNSTEFGFLEFGDAPTNLLSVANKIPEALELVRGKTARIIGSQTSLFSIVKNLPLGVHRDLQENKTAVFETVDALRSCLQIVSIILKSLRVNETKTLAAVTENYLNAAELTDYLVQRNVPFKAAQSAVGEIVSYAAAQEKKLENLSLEEFRRFSEAVGDDVFSNLSQEQMLASKNQIGGTSPERVFEALEHARESLQREDTPTGKK